jgi:hypothetical protein
MNKYHRVVYSHSDFGKVYHYINKGSFCDDWRNTNWCRGKFEGLDDSFTDGTVLVVHDTRDESKSFLMLYPQKEMYDVNGDNMDWYIPMWLRGETDVSSQDDSGSNFFKMVRGVLKSGLDPKILERDPMVESVDVRTPVGSSEVIIDFEGDNVLDILGLFDDDYWMINAVFNPYNSYDYETGDSYEDLLRDGDYFTMGGISPENHGLVSEIYKLLPDTKISKAAILGFLMSYGDLTDIADNLQEILAGYENEAIRGGAKKSIQKIGDEYFGKQGFQVNFSRSILKTKLSNLYYQYVRNRAEHLNLKDFLQKLFYNEDGPLTGVSEDQYDYRDEDFFDGEGFNSDVNKQYLLALEKISDDMTDEKKSFIKFLVDQKYIFGQPLKKVIIDGKGKFVRGYDLKTDMLILSEISGGWGPKTRMSRENFLNLTTNERFNFDD